MLRSVPGGISFTGCATVAVPGRPGCRKWWWLPVTRTSLQQSDHRPAIHVYLYTSRGDQASAGCLAFVRGRVVADCAALIRPTLSLRCCQCFEDVAGRRQGQDVAAMPEGVEQQLPGGETVAPA